MAVPYRCRLAKRRIRRVRAHLHCPYLQCRRFPLRKYNSFFLLPSSDYPSLTDEDVEHFSQASLNTAPSLRTTAMIIAATEWLKKLRPNSLSPPPFICPCGVVERFWCLLDLWTRNPGGIPSSIRMDGNYFNYGDFLIAMLMADAAGHKDIDRLYICASLFLNDCAGFCYFTRDYAAIDVIPPHPLA
jgi:hypothetical protein